jgi:cystathionine gamma-synthase
MKLETIAIHAGNHTDPNSGAVVQPITLSTTFERGLDGEFPSGYISIQELIIRIENR